MMCDIVKMDQMLVKRTPINEQKIFGSLVAILLTRYTAQFTIFGGGKARIRPNTIFRGQEK